MLPLRWIRSVRAWAKKRPEAAVVTSLALALAFVVVVLPLSLAEYPPLVDLPFHAAQTSIIRHYLDPSWHFREQFTLHPLEVPYLSMYGIGAVASLALPIGVAAKVMAVSMLFLPPVGLAVLFWGMRKSPWLGLFGLSLTWCTLTQWGFLSFMGALGLFAMSLGLALRVVDRPSPLARLALAVALVAVFFTHVYRAPFAIAGTLLAGAAVYPATRRFRPLLISILPALGVFMVWLAVRPASLAEHFTGPALDLGRLAEVRRHLFGSFTPPEPLPQSALGAYEARLAWTMLATLGVAFAVSIASGSVGRRPDERSERDRLWSRGVTALPLVIAAVLTILYLTLPMKIGSWWYVYPREAVGALLFLLAAMPDLPAMRGRRWSVLALAAVASVPMAGFVARQYARFDAQTRDFAAIVAEIPKAPKLFYLIYQLRGTDRRISPYLHLPAWVQAEKGGALDFHFAAWNLFPVRYRESGDWVPPPLPDHFEWEPQRFRVTEHGAWFDTFLVRHTIDPGVLFVADPSIQLVARRGTWWLYRRTD
jgi:hypothetical protein